MKKIGMKSRCITKEWVEATTRTLQQLVLDIAGQLEGFVIKVSIAEIFDEMLDSVPII